MLSFDIICTYYTDVRNEKGMLNLSKSPPPYAIIRCVITAPPYSTTRLHRDSPRTDSDSAHSRGTRQAGIQLWVLTGDKLETARNIGFSTRLLSTSMDRPKTDRPAEAVEPKTDSPNAVRCAVRGRAAWYGPFWAAKPVKVAKPAVSEAAFSSKRRQNWSTNWTHHSSELTELESQAKMAWNGDFWRSQGLQG